MKDNLPKPPGEQDSGVDKFATHSKLSKSFGLQRKTLERLIKLEKRVDKLDGISEGLFKGIAKSLNTIDSNLRAITTAFEVLNDIQADALADQDLQDSRDRDTDKKLDMGKFLGQTEAAILKPVMTVEKKAKGIFDRLFEGLTAIFGGWLIDKLGDAMEAWKAGDLDKLEEIKENVTKGLMVIGGLFLAQQIGISAITGALTSLVTSIMFNIPMVIAALGNPITWLAFGAIIAAVGTYFWQQEKKKEIAQELRRNQLERDIRGETITKSEKLVEEQNLTHEKMNERPWWMSLLINLTEGGELVRRGNRLQDKRLKNLTTQELAIHYAMEQFPRTEENVRYLHALNQLWGRWSQIKAQIESLQTELENAQPEQKIEIQKKIDGLQLLLTKRGDEIKVMEENAIPEIKTIINVMKDASVMHLPEDQREAARIQGIRGEMYQMLEAIRTEGWKGGDPIFSMSGWQGPEFDPRLHYRHKYDHNEDTFLVKPDLPFSTSSSGSGTVTGDTSTIKGNNTDTSTLSKKIETNTNIAIVPIGVNGQDGVGSDTVGGDDSSQIPDLATVNVKDPNLGVTEAIVVP